MEKARLEKIKRIFYVPFIEINGLNDLLELGQNLFFHNKDNEMEQIGKVFNLVKRNFPSDLHNILLYLLGELFDNISQHSNYSNCLFILSYNNELGIGRIAIMDDGISIPKAFEKKGINFKDDDEAIEMALRGISTKIESGRGFGLSSTKKLVEKALKGMFVIISRKGIYSSGKKSSRQLNLFNGTAIYLEFRDSGKSGKNLNIYKYLE
nr:hypothetical protein [uncultured archaeon]AQS34283.1 hypothetical protein [uncultured archaeon]AQS34748.1 hypothetical protein [uncultured archaeon]